MGFKSEKQRVGFFSNLKDKFHKINEERHQRAVEKLTAQIKAKRENLQAEAAKFKKESDIVSLKKKAKALDTAEREVKSARFKASTAGKVTAFAKRVGITAGSNIKGNVSRFIEFEKKHGKDQIKSLQKVGKKLSKLR